MADARRPAAQKAHGTVGTDGGSARTPVSEVSSAVQSPTTRIGAIAAIMTALNGTIFVPSRLAIMFVEDGLAPRWLGFINKTTATPIRGLTLTLICLVASPAWAPATVSAAALTSCWTISGWAIDRPVEISETTASILVRRGYDDPAEAGLDGDADEIVLLRRALKQAEKVIALMAKNGLVRGENGLRGIVTRGDLLGFLMK